MLFRAFLISLLYSARVLSADFSNILARDGFVAPLEYQSRALDQNDVIRCMQQSPLPVLHAQKMSWAVEKTMATLNDAQCSNSSLFVAYDANHNLRVMTEYQGFLYEYNFDQEIFGDLRGGAYGVPEVVSRYGYVQGIPYFLSELGNIWLWDKSSDVWVNSTADLGLPVGEISEIVSTGSGLLVSIVGSVNEGTWLYSDGNSQKISDIPFQVGGIYPWTNGYVILDQTIPNQTVLEFTASGHREQLTYESIEKLSVRLEASGGLIEVGAAGRHIVLWKGVDDTEFTYMTDPVLTDLMKGCFSDDGRHYCVFKMKSGFHNVFEVSDGIYLFDSQIDTLNVYGDSVFTDLKRVGSVLLMSIYNPNQDGSGDTILYEVNEAGEGVLMKAIDAYSFFIRSPDSNVMYWVAKGVGKFQLSLLDLNTSVEGRDGDENTSDRAALGGTFSHYFFGFMFLLILGRRKNKM